MPSCAIIIVRGPIVWQLCMGGKIQRNNIGDEFYAVFLTSNFFSCYWYTTLAKYVFTVCFFFFFFFLLISAETTLFWQLIGCQWLFDTIFTIFGQKVVFVFNFKYSRSIQCNAVAIQALTRCRFFFLTQH